MEINTAYLLRNKRLENCRKAIGTKQQFFDEKIENYHKNILDTENKDQVAFLHTQQKKDMSGYQKMLRQINELNLRENVSMDRFVFNTK